MPATSGAAVSRERVSMLVTDVIILGRRLTKGSTLLDPVRIRPLVGSTDNTHATSSSSKQRTALGPSSNLALVINRPHRDQWQLVGKHGRVGVNVAAVVARREDDGYVEADQDAEHAPQPGDAHLGDGGLAGRQATRDDRLAFEASLCYVLADHGEGCYQCCDVVVCHIHGYEVSFRC